MSEERSGILLINKEAGMTSHDVVAILRRLLHTKKIGHSGTLDPNATGVLLVLVNNATKVLPYLEDTDKEYVATLMLGKRTFTDDIWGDTLETKEITPINNLQEILNKYLGDIKQLPPMVSAVRVNGRKLYEYARANESVERPIRDVKIHQIQAIEGDDEYKFKVHCSSGTYIRTLCVDIAADTNNLGCMSSLVRTMVGRFSLEDCVSLADVEAGNYKLFSINDALAHYHTIKYEPMSDVYNGKRIKIDCKEDIVAIEDGDKIVAMYGRETTTTFKSLRGLW
ncbi:MAG: tRNA pseudouridine(55) synthase TruB [Erysipelotrichaceae bacterium]